MKYYYGEYDGSEFPTQESLFGFDSFMQFIMQYGQQAMDALQQLMQNPKNEAQEQLLQKLLDEGMLEKDSEGNLRLTPRATGRMQQKALLEVFANLRRGQRDGHEKMTRGSGGERIEGTKPYEFGDPVSEMDLHQTLHNALARRGLPSRRDEASGRAAIHLDETDLELHLHEGLTSCSTVVLLDMSGSMMRYNRYLSAKKVAMAMQALVRGRFPQDTLDFVSFYSGAQRVPETLLPLVMPKPVTVHHSEVRLRIPVDQIEQAPAHFTNLHMGLQMARRILKRRGGENKQIFIITDGQPTAHVEDGFVYLMYPPDRHSTIATLKEANLAVRDGCRISTFALIEDYWGMEWVGFVDQLTRMTKGVAFYTSSGELANCIMESYLSGRKKKAYIG